MNLQELQNLQEAYLDVYQELGEQKIDFYAGKLKSGHSPESALNTKYVNITNRLRKDTKSPKDKKKLKSRLNTLYNTRDKVEREYDKTQKESYDLYDIILSYLLDEGYAETQEAAEVMMVNMSEDWRDSILEKFISPYEGKPSYNNPQGHSPATKAMQKSDELQRTEPGSKRQRMQTRRSQQLNRTFQAARRA